jgi:hypothetical protein
MQVALKSFGFGGHTGDKSLRLVTACAAGLTHFFSELEAEAGSTLVQLQAIMYLNSCY